MDFHANVVLNAPHPGDEGSVEQLVDGLIDGLETYGGTVTATACGRLGLTFTVAADTLQEATTTALAVATATNHPEPIALEVSPASGL